MATADAERSAELPVSDAATFCATLVDEWIRAGLTDAVVAPGSRSTPLALALDAGGLRVHVHPDERAAAFVALGIGVATGRPAVVLTTSGTAAVEVHPAVVESHHAAVPMIVCTADRPPALHDVGAAQTIDQHRLFGVACRWFAAPGVPNAAVDHTWRPLAARAVSEAMGSPPGPVHLNLAFDEPLVGRPGPLPAGRRTGAPWANDRPRPAWADGETVEAVASAIAGRRGLIVAGGGVEDPDGVLALAEAAGWPIVADPRSGCRVPGSAPVAHADGILRSAAAADALTPEVVLHLGTPPASKVLARWLAGLDAWQLGVEAHGRRFDPDRILAGMVAAEPGGFCAGVAGCLRGWGHERGAMWAAEWARADAQAAEAIATVLRAPGPMTEPAVAREVMACVPDGTTLVVSSSMPVRDLEWFGVPRTGVRVVANRGANGIDGVVSTGMGVALAAAGAPDADVAGPAPVVVLVGDLAFVHDTNALVGLAARNCNCTVVVLDNDGGGIFSFLPQATALDAEVFERLFGTPHHTDLVALARAHGVAAAEVGSVDDLRASLAAATGSEGAQVLVVRTDRATNVDVHERLHIAVSDAVQRTLDATD